MSPSEGHRLRRLEISHGQLREGAGHLAVDEASGRGWRAGGRLSPEKLLERRQQSHGCFFHSLMLEGEHALLSCSRLNETLPQNVYFVLKTLSFDFFIAYC